ncbi:hypothetical protein [Aureimonas endophytica]|uniref:hypothetical protein n=1 Tax=Aureimonas endophytica TaxID=2027858 RepID=UPI001AEE7BB0|nr:hypothetical protein [Aureimonas endophytica]
MGSWVKGRAVLSFRSGGHLWRRETSHLAITPTNLGFVFVATIGQRLSMGLNPAFDASHSLPVRFSAETHHFSFLDFCQKTRCQAFLGVFLVLTVVFNKF